MKLTVLGGGGVRSAFLAKSLAYNAHRIGLTEVVFLDNSADNLAIFGEIARYVFNTIRPDIQFSTTTDPVAALQDANYIITTLRVGGDESRIRDERIALEHNTLGQRDHRRRRFRDGHALDPGDPSLLPADRRTCRRRRYSV